METEKKVDDTLKKIIHYIKKNKEEIKEINLFLVKEIKNLKSKAYNIRLEIISLITSIDNEEEKLNSCKNLIKIINENRNKYSEERIKEVYTEVSEIRIKVAILNEREKHLASERNDFEKRIIDLNKIASKSDGIYNNMGIVENFLEGSLSSALEMVEDQGARRGFGKYIITVQEKERERIANDVHDGVAQLMACVVLKTELCSKLISKDLEKTEEELKNLKEISKQSLKELRRVIYDIRPLNLEGFGLNYTLKKMFLSIKQQFEIDVEYKYKIDEEIECNISNVLYRIVQESMNNIIKHSKADIVRVDIYRKNDQIRLNIKDNGIGFDEKQFKKNKKQLGKYGLCIMEERVKLLMGDITIKSNSIEGTKILVVVPIN